MKTNTNKIYKVVGLGLFTAIVVVLQLLGSFIKFGTFSISLVLIPLVVGSAVYGIGAGAWLGLVFGVTVLASGDASLFLAVNPVGTVITVLAKGIMAGLMAGVVFKALEKKSTLGAVVSSAIASPVFNTGIFLIGCRLFFYPTIQGWASAAGMENVGAYMIVGLVGLNFVVELAINLVLSSAIVKIIDVARKENKKKIA
jgi:uncharacterized membrane protein